jgi:SAM-dependent methyltransferase
MNASAAVMAVLRCPGCRHTLAAAGEGWVCTGPERHTFGCEGGLPTFASIDPGKYGSGYAKQYAALWAYGFASRHSGLNEPLYRTVAALSAEALTSTSARSEEAVIVDAGCGVGRTTADCAQLAPTAAVLGFDGSPHMLALAARIVQGSSPVRVDLRHAGFRRLTIAGRGLPQVFLARADVERLPVADDCADLVLSVNIVDRLPRGPEPALRECHRLLRPGGWLVFTDPLNFQQRELWKRYGAGGSSAAMGRLIAKVGFRVETWFDDLWYREVLDARGSFEEFRTLVVKARKAPSQNQLSTRSRVRSSLESIRVR